MYAILRNEARGWKEGTGEESVIVAVNLELQLSMDGYNHVGFILYFICVYTLLYILGFLCINVHGICIKC